MGTCGGNIGDGDPGIPAYREGSVRSISCTVTDALERLEQSVDALIRGPLTPGFVRRLHLLKLVDGSELDLFMDLLRARRELECALADSKTGRS